MLFSILIANYNNGKYFPDCFNSILDQSYENWEAIIVDDQSTDDSLEVIQSLIKNDKRFRLYQNTINQGCGYTKNKCAEYAQGEILGFLDPDDTLTPNALEVMVQNHKTNLETSIITSKYKLFSDENSLITICDHAGSIPDGESYLSYGKPLLTSFATFKNKFYQETNRINPKLKRAVDQDLYLKMEEVGTHLFIDKVLYNYRAHENNISRNENSLKAEFWHARVIKMAYKRRLIEGLNIRNLKETEIDKVYCNYYFKRLESTLRIFSFNWLLKLSFLFIKKKQYKIAFWYFLYQVSTKTINKGVFFRRKFIAAFNSKYANLGYRL